MAVTFLETKLGGLGLCGIFNTIKVKYCYYVLFHIDEHVIKSRSLIVCIILLIIVRSYFKTVHSAETCSRTNILTQNILTKTVSDKGL